MKDPPPTYATQVTKKTVTAYNVAMGKTPEAPAAPSAAIENGTAPPRSDQPAPAPRLENVPESGGTGVGAEIVTPSSNGTGTEAAPPAANPPAAAPPAAVGSSTPAGGSSAPVTAIPDNGGLKAVGPADATALPAVDKPADAPSQVNDVKAPATVTTGTTSAAADKSKYDASKESSSKHKKKKGLDKLNPF
jgi:outer membrane protein assembly factor BamD